MLGDVYSKVGSVRFPCVTSSGLEEGEGRVYSFTPNQHQFSMCLVVVVGVVVLGTILVEVKNCALIHMSENLCHLICGSKICFLRH